MAFTSAVSVLQNVDGGELLTTSPYGVTAYTSYQDNLNVGRIAQMKAGVVSNLDATATPDLVGVVLRQIGSSLEDGTALSGVSSVDVCDFGRATVYTATGAVPTAGSAVYVINAVGDDAGKVTQDSGATGAVAVTDAVFYKEVKSGVWTITLKKYMK